jgi:hypothetical protein
MTRIRQVIFGGPNGNQWTFGKGQNNYVTGTSGIVQNINTRLSSFLGDCYFNLGAGIDWFNLLGTKDKTALNLAINAAILNTGSVTGIIQTVFNLDPTTRRLTVQYKVQTTLGPVSSVFQYDTNGIG